MMYDAYQAMADVGDRVRSFAASAEAILGVWQNRPYASPLQRMAAYYEVVALAGFTHERPDYAIEDVEVQGAPRAVTQRISTRTPFCNLLHFQKEGGADEPRVLLVAPMSGHFATLLRGTVRTLLRDHQVYITDWVNPRNVKLEAGRFGAGGIHPAPHRFRPPYRRRLPHRRGLPALRLRARRDRRDGDGRRQRTAGEPDADGGPDRRAGRAEQGQRARHRETVRVVSRQPDRHRALEVRGPGPAGLSRLPPAFRLHEHELRAPFQGLRRPLPARVDGDIEKADAIKEFYKEYFAIMDMTADFYLETIDQVFQRFLLPKGEMSSRAARSSRGRSARPSCSPSRARATTSARSARPSRRRTSARAFAPT